MTANRFQVCFVLTFVLVIASQRALPAGEMETFHFISYPGAYSYEPPADGYVGVAIPYMNGNLGLFEGELAEWLGAEDGESIPLFGPVYVKPGSGPYWWASFWTKDLRPGDRIVDIVVYDPFPDGSLKGSGTVIRREGWHTTLFTTSEELNIEGYDGVITGNFNSETGAYKTVFIPRNGPPIKADVVPFDGLWLADRLTNIIALDTDPDSGERLYLCDAEY